jgi:hypothetical protein
LSELVRVGEHSGAAEAAEEKGAVWRMSVAWDKNPVILSVTAHRALEALVVAASFLADSHQTSLSNERSIMQEVRS